jgi:phospholipid/cholesterol/gamma-HCH transport system substrate-binding protein
VRRFNDSLVAAAGLLKDERGNLAASLHNLGIAMREVSSFVRQNKGALSRNIHGLNQVSKVLVKQRAALDETLTDAPLALTNLFHTYNPKSGTLDTRTNLGENINALTADPAAVLCAIVHQGDPSGQACDAIKNALGGGGGLPLSGINRSAPFGSHAHTPVVNVEHIDRSLGGIVAVK